MFKMYESPTGNFIPVILYESMRICIGVGSIKCAAKGCLVAHCLSLTGIRLKRIFRAILQYNRCLSKQVSLFNKH